MSMLAKTSSMQGRWKFVSFAMRKKWIACLVLFEAVLKDVLNDQATSLTKSNLVPHATESLVDVLHNLRWRLGPAKLEKLLPDVASIAVNDSLRDTTK